MKTIYKYPLVIEDSQNIPIPEGSEFLSIQEQNDLPIIYFLVDPSQDKFPLEFRLLETGQPLEESSLEGFLYLGTVLTYLGGKLTWHIFAKQSLAWRKRQ